MCFPHCRSVAAVTFSHLSTEATAHGFDTRQNRSSVGVRIKCSSRLCSISNQHDALEGCGRACYRACDGRSPQLKLLKSLGVHRLSVTSCTCMQGGGNAVLVGHALHHDLRALRLDYQPVIDTSLLLGYKCAPTCPAPSYALPCIRNRSPCCHFWRLYTDATPRFAAGTCEAFRL